MGESESGGEIEDPPDFEDLIEGEASDEAIAAWNEDVEADLDARLDERMADLAESEQEAVDALLEEAETSAETTTVEFPSGLELDVRTRIPPAVEHKQERLERLEDQDAPLRDIARVNCEMLAAMVETDGYDSAETWVTVYEQQGIQWLSEMTAEVLEPAVDAADELGNRLCR